jgi:putative two-component system response regulator
MQSQPLPDPEARPDLLFVNSSETCARHVQALRVQFRLTLAHTVSTAFLAMGRSTPALVVSDLELPDGDAVEICRRAKRSSIPATVLVTTAAPERVPAALLAGCDGVLLKPFAPNLLYARIGRLVRLRSMQLRVRASHDVIRVAYWAGFTTPLEMGTNRVWRSLHCPQCERGGVVSFDHASHHRDWFACLSCKHVWLAPSAASV